MACSGIRSPRKRISDISACPAEKDLISGQLAFTAPWQSRTYSITFEMPVRRVSKLHMARWKPHIASSISAHAPGPTLGTRQRCWAGAAVRGSRHRDDGGVSLLLLQHRPGHSRRSRCAGAELGRRRYHRAPREMARRCRRCVWSSSSSRLRAEPLQSVRRLKANIDPQRVSGRFNTSRAAASGLSHPKVAELRVAWMRTRISGLSYLVCHFAHSRSSSG